MIFNKKIRYVFFPVFSILFVIGLILFSFIEVRHSSTRHISELGGNCVISLNSKAIPARDPGRLHFNNLKKGDTVIISTKIARSDEIPGYCLVFPSNRASVLISIDHKLAYSFYADACKKGVTAPKNFNVFALPANEDGVIVTIILTATSNNAFSGIGPIYFGSYYDIWLVLLGERILQLSIGFFLVLLAYILIIMFPFFKLVTSRHNILFMELFLLCSGLYTLCYSDVITLMTYGSHLYYYLEYITFYFIAFCVLGFIMSEHLWTTTSGEKILGMVFLAFPITACIVSYFTKLTLYNFVKPYYVLSALGSAYMIYILALQSRKRRIRKTDTTHIVNYTNFYLSGFIFFTICNAVSIYQNLVYIADGTTANYCNHGSIMSIGMLVFSLCMLMSCFLNDIDSTYEASEREKIKGLAYTDELTGLANRAHFNQLSKSGFLTMKAYTIISIDLDHLKNVNDTFGHDHGDKLLVNFASLLKNTFKSSYLTGRMGGYEFIVVIPYQRNSKINEIMKKLTVSCNSLSKNSPFPYEFSWGSADYLEKRYPSLENIYDIADSRMYQMKQIHHNQKGGII